MPTQTDTTNPTNADRLAGVVGSLQGIVAQLPQFRPTDQAAQKVFDAMFADSLTLVSMLSAAAAVDQARIIAAEAVVQTAKDQAAVNADALAARSKLRDQTDAAMLQASTIPFGKGVA
jgi:capsule polysaccharide export protein KpsE/RkpR